MQQIRLDSKEGVAAGWAGVGDARNLPARARAKASVSKPDIGADDQPPRRGLLSAALRFARNAGIGLLLLSAVPFGTVIWHSKHLTTRTWSDTRLKLTDVDRARVLKSPIDASITPMDAGIAFAALQAPQTGAPTKANALNSQADEQFPARAGAQQPMWPWRAHRPGKDIFEIRTGGFDGPSSQEVVSNAQHGFSPAEMAWLKELAEAPVWKDFDKVGSAQSIDLIGGQFQLPFHNDAFAPVMPFVKFAGTKELAHAGVARAAYYLALNQPERAEAALRSVISFGFAMMDNGTSALDGMIGRVIVGIGRNGFEQYATYPREFPAGYDPTPGPKIKNTNYGALGESVSAEELRQQLLNDLSDPSVPRTIRYEQLSQLSLTSCNTIPEMLFGPGQETRDAFAQAASTLVRFPSEQALLDLILDQTNRIPETQVPSGLAQRLVVGAATVAATITNNPRLASCTKLAVLYR